MGVSILIVDDHAALSVGLERYLVLAGHSVSTADSVKAAVNCTKNNQFDLLLIDLQLPDGTGWELLEILSDKRPVRAIAMSGMGNASDLARSETAGFIRHLIKPITPEDLTEAILHVMNCPPFSPTRSASDNRSTRKGSPRQRRVRGPRP
jgi:CheY-like chemotaxis protein